MNKIVPARRGTATALFAVMITALLVIAVLDFGPLIGVGVDADAILTLLAALIFVFVHGAIALGPRHMIAFSLITVVISFSSEAIGVATGLVFGAYHYTDQLGPKLLGVPPMIQIGYLATGYASVMMGRIILSLLRPVTGWAVLAASGGSVHHGELGRGDGSVPVDRDRRLDLARRRRILRRPFA